MGDAFIDELEFVSIEYELSWIAASIYKPNEHLRIEEIRDAVP